MSARIALDLEIDGRRLEAEELPGAPDERPLVLLHEGLGSVSTWRGFPEALQRATCRRVIVFSRLGHGRSDSPPAPRTPTFFHEEALVVLPASSACSTRTSPFSSDTVTARRSG